VTTLRPELRRYEATARVQPEAALRSTPAEDILVALRQADSAKGGILVEAFQIPLVTLVWWGGLLVIAGGAMALRPSRPTESIARTSSAERRFTEPLLPVLVGEGSTS